MSLDVLMVDDELDILYSTRLQLANRLPKAKFEGLTDPHEAIERIRTAPPDVLITDLRMPKLPGQDLILAAREVDPQLPVVVVTAYGSSDLRRSLTQLGSIEYLEKPFSFDQLLTSVEKASERTNGFSGSISLTMLPDLIQMYALTRATGQLEVSKGLETGEIWFEGGEIVHARCGEIEGEEAVYHLLTWHGGRFTMRNDSTPLKKSIQSTWQQVLLEGCRLMDESGREEEDPGEEALDLGLSAEGSIRPFLQRGEGEPMSTVKEGLEKLSSIDGYIGSCVVDSGSGMMMGSNGGGAAFNLEVASAGNTEVVRAKLKTMAALGLKDEIEDILITLGKQYHLIRLIAGQKGLFAYLVLDKGKANLGMARHVLAGVERELTF